MAFFRYLRIFLFTILILSVVYPTYSQENDSEKAKALNQQVIKLYRQGRYQEAIKIAEKVLAISEKALGPDHPRVATSLNNLALLYYSLGDYAKAEPLYKRSLVIWDFQNTRKTKKKFCSLTLGWTGMRGKTPVHRSAIVERVKYEMKADKVLKKRIQDLADKITNSQRQT